MATTKSARTSDGLTEPRQFDLNIEKVLEDWGPAEALREVIANALDEQALTKTAPVGSSLL